MKPIKRLSTLSLCLLLSLLAACEQGGLDLIDGFQANIVSFSADPSAIQAGESTTLKWLVLGGPEDLPITLTPGDIELSRSGSYQIKPTETTTYTLVAGSAGKVVTKEVTVDVVGNLPVPPTPEPSTPNQAPVISDIPNQTMVLGDTLSIPFTVTDDTFERLQLGTSLVSDPNKILPNLAKTSGRDGTYTLELTPLGVGTVELAIYATDAEGLIDSVEFAVTVEPRDDAGFDPDYIGTFEFEPATVEVGSTTTGFLNLSDSVDCSISVNGAEPYKVDCVGDISFTPEEVGVTNVEINAFKADGFHIFLKGSFEAVKDELPIVEDGAVSILNIKPVQLTLTAEDPEGEQVFFQIASQPEHGTLEVYSEPFFDPSGDYRSSGGVVIYTPDEGFVGTDAFTYKASTNATNLGELLEPKSEAATFTITVSANPTNASTPCDVRIVAVRDFYLREKIYQVLGISEINADVTCAQLASLETLDATGEYIKGSTTEGVRDLSGIEHAVNLKKLVLRRSLVEDYSLLAELKSLEELYFLFDPLPNLSQLAQIENLKILHLDMLQLDSTQEIDLSGIEALTGLEELSLIGSGVKDISPLLELPWAGANDVVVLSGQEDIPDEQIEALKEKVETVKLD